MDERHGPGRCVRVANKPRVAGTETRRVQIRGNGITAVSKRSWPRFPLRICPLRYLAGFPAQGHVI